MKHLLFLLILIPLQSCSQQRSGKSEKLVSDRSFTASTPANMLVRNFLGIAPSDTVDFIRWKLAFQADSYQLYCHYGLGKAGTNGFINGGSKLALKGSWHKDGHIYTLKNKDKILRLAELNENLIHLLNPDNSMMAGNAGWSYTLNSTNPVPDPDVYVSSGTVHINKLVNYQGRTPCNIPGMKSKEKDCHKWKWDITLYADSQGKPGAYKLLTQTWPQDGGRTGKWHVTGNADAGIVYKLDDASGNEFLRLLKVDDNILLFLGEGDELLVGNEDFSYTVSRSK
jgi:hypothetical protein